MAEPPDMNYWLGVKYSILGKQAEGEYQRNTADASSLPGLREAQGFNLRAGGQQSLESAATDAARRYMDPEWLRGAYRQLNEGQLPPTIAPPSAGAGAIQAPAALGAGQAPVVQAPTTGATPVQAPTQTQAPAQETRPPIQFQTLPPQPAPGAPAAPPASVLPTTDVAPVAPRPTGTLSPQLQTPEQLTQGALNAAARRQQQLPPLPTLVRPLSRQGFRRGTANVKRQGLKKGTPDVKPDEGTSSLLLQPMLGAAPSPPPAVPMPSTAPDARSSFVPLAGPAVGPSAAPSGPYTPLPPSGPYTPVPSTPNVGPSAGPSTPLPPSGPYTPVPGPGPAPATGLQPAGTWPGGAPKGFNYEPGAESLAGPFNAATRMVNPEAFNQALESFPPSTNIDDRRGEAPGTISLSTYANRAADLLNPMPLITDIGRALFGGDRAAPGSLAAQAGFNSIPGSNAGGILSGISNSFGSSPSAGQPLAGPAGAPSQASPPPASSTVVAPAAPAPASPQPSPSSTSESQGLKKGSADVKGKGKGKTSSGPPQGLEALLPLLMAMQGGGSGGPPAGTPPARGFKKGSANVKGKSKASKGDDQSSGLEALLSALAAGGGGGAVGPPAAGALPLPMPMAPGAAALPAQVRGYAAGGDVQMIPPTVPPLMPMMLPPTDNRYARGEENVDQHPGYPFGAGYLFGATAVPGEGTGRTDTVPAMLAPHEAVLNRAAADMLGRGLIAALNQRGVKQMGMHRGAA